MRTFIIVLALLAFCASLGAQNRVIQSKSLPANPRLLNSLINSKSDEMDTSDTFTIIYPNGGETFYVDSTYAIRWSSEGSYTSNVNLFYSTDSGASWLNIASNVPDNGQYSWTVPNTPSVNCRVKVKDVNDTGEHGDTSDNNFTITTIGFNSYTSASHVPLNYSISNAPNPFKSTTRITYSVKEACNVSIKVYDLTGREVAVVKDGAVKPGEYIYTWNASKYAAGMYICKFIAGDKTIVHRMTIVK
ncbi:MAG: T9SS type A sorting domain-containing protein [Candidatus Coatesbacteria bacterium]|nr:T9SS type A sorting domain-containing protein [Candidatus Coatesbacteria bacterium]